MYVWKMDGAIRTTPAKPPSMDQWEALKAMTCPVLVLRGAKSDVLNADIAGRMLQALPNGKLVEVPGVGHAPVLTEPEAKAALDAFLGG
jgi:pimeloyl-ACP methyl ester carboxylesterase